MSPQSGHLQLIHRMKATTFRKEEVRRLLRWMRLKVYLENITGSLPVSSLHKNICAHAREDCYGFRCRCFTADHRCQSKNNLPPPSAQMPMSLLHLSSQMSKFHCFIQPSYKSLTFLTANPTFSVKCLHTFITEIRLKLLKDM